MLTYLINKLRHCFFLNKHLILWQLIFCVMEDGSGSDSDCSEESYGVNVSRFCAFPVGLRKPGHLIFNADFECGNLGRVDYVSDFEYDLYVRPDTFNARFRVWFYFTVENVRIDQRVIFNIVNFSKTKSLYRDGMSPVVKSTSRASWMRIPHKNVFYYRCPDHNKNYVMSFAFCFDSEKDTFHFAYCYPYSYTQLQNYLESIELKKYNFFQRELLASTSQQRRLDLITIGNKNTTYFEKKKVVFITARVHPGETPSSLVCQGIIDYLCSYDPVAKYLRDHVIFKIVPMLNPDGVYNGNYRCSILGFDLNRHWQEPSPWSHPTIYATKNLLLKLDNSKKCDLDFYIDIHAHSTLMNGFMYGNVYEDSTRHERQALFPKLFCQNADDFSLANTNFNNDAIKAGTGRRALGDALDEKCHCYTLEVSFYSYTSSGKSYTLPYTESAYMKLGQNLIKTFYDYYKMTGQINLFPMIDAHPSAHSEKREYTFHNVGSEPWKEKAAISEESNLPRNKCYQDK